MAILSEFGLKKGSGDVVRALVRDMQFIYPSTPNVSEGHNLNGMMLIMMIARGRRLSAVHTKTKPLFRSSNMNYFA